MAFAQKTIARKMTSVRQAPTIQDLSEEDIPEDTEESPEQELARLRAENAKLKQGRGLNLKVSEKGALSVYGLGRFPVTLYKEQWLKLLSMVDAIKDFIKANDKDLKSKDQK